MLRAHNMGKSITTTPQREPTVVPELSRSPEPVQKLPLGSNLRDALARTDFPTIKAVASLSLLTLGAFPEFKEQPATAAED